MRPLLLLVAGLALVGGPAFAATPAAVEGFYDGTASCPGGEVQIMLSLDAGAADAIDGSLTVVPLKGARMARAEYKVSGTIGTFDTLELKGPGKVAFSGIWYEEDLSGDTSITGQLADSGCDDFSLVVDPMSQ
ncbi:MAG: hypothetical protein JWR84_3436 [Caulobacter sp.]|nr:hypothetical protein [Caulobacter sp.]